MAEARKLLIVGPPRSGTTWVGRVLAATPGTRVVHEPDNELIDSFALRAKAGRGRYPVLGPRDEAPDYERLWAAAFGAGERSLSPTNLASLALLKRTPVTAIDRALDAGIAAAGARARLAATLAAPRRRGRPEPIQVVKSVHSAFALPFLAARFAAPTIVVLRNPLNAIASWLELGFTPRRFAARPEVLKRVIEPLGVAAPADDDPLTDLAFSYMLLATAIRAAAGELPDCVVVEHEWLCEDPVSRFRELFARVGLPMTAATADHIAASDRAGRAYKTNRLAAEQAERWRDRLDPAQAEKISAVVDSFAAARS